MTRPLLLLAALLTLLAALWAWWHDTGTQEPVAAPFRESLDVDYV